MASVPGPLRMPDPKAKPKKKIDIPYNRWQNRIRRYVKTAILIAVLIAIAAIIITLATLDDVTLNIAFGIVGGILQILMVALTAMVGIVAPFGLLFWFLSRPKVEIIRPGDDTTVTFDDYWGQAQLVKLVKQWMSLLRDRKDFEKMGGKYIGGLLLYGPPGTGKTMLAKAIAGESGMAFISSAGISFQGMFRGIDILMVLRYSRMARSLARKYGACVAYIDEIDAIGMNRGGVSGAGMGLGTYVLSTLLSQMDGMNNPTRTEKLNRRLWKLFGRTHDPHHHWHVMWMGSTNRPDVLDPALTRSGRLDTRIAVDPPDRASRRLIVEGYLSRVEHDESVDVESIVADTNGLTPADIAGAITKDAVRLAFFDERRRVSQKDIDMAFLERSKEIVQIIAANQMPEGLGEDMIPQTPAAIRARSLAEARSGISRDNSTVDEPALIVPEKRRQSPADATEGDGKEGETVAVGSNENSRHAPEPEVIQTGTGGYEPQLENRDEEPRSEPQLINDSRRAEQREP